MCRAQKFVWLAALFFPISPPGRQPLLLEALPQPSRAVTHLAFYSACYLFLNHFFLASSLDLGFADPSFLLVSCVSVPSHVILHSLCLGSRLGSNQIDSGFLLSTSIQNGIKAQRRHAPAYGRRRVQLLHFGRTSSNFVPSHTKDKQRALLGRETPFQYRTTLHLQRCSAVQCSANQGSPPGPTSRVSAPFRRYFGRVHWCTGALPALPSPLKCPDPRCKTPTYLSRPDFQWGALPHPVTEDLRPTSRFRSFSNSQKHPRRLRLAIQRPSFRRRLPGPPPNHCRAH